MSSGSLATYGTSAGGEAVLELPQFSPHPLLICQRSPSLRLSGLAVLSISPTSPTCCPPWFASVYVGLASPVSRNRLPGINGKCVFFAVISPNSWSMMILLYWRKGSQGDRIRKVRRRSGSNHLCGPTLVLGTRPGLHPLRREMR